MIALAAVALGLALGAAAGGRLAGVGHARLRFEWLVFLLFIAQAVARGRIVGTREGALGFAIWAFSCVGLLLLLATNWRMPGVWVLSVGIAMNLFVVLLNGGMPIVTTGEPSAGVARVLASSGVGFYALAGPGTVLGMFGDVIRLSAADGNLLASPGDILLALGVVVFLVDAMGTHADESSMVEMKTERGGTRPV